MTCKRLLIPTKRGSCSPRSRFHTLHWEVGGCLCAPSPAGPPAAPSTPSSSSKGGGSEENTSPRWSPGSIPLASTPAFFGWSCRHCCGALYSFWFEGTSLPQGAQLIQASPCSGGQRMRGQVSGSGVLTRSPAAVPWAAVLVAMGLFEARGELVWGTYAMLMQHYL